MQQALKIFKPERSTVLWLSIVVSIVVIIDIHFFYERGSAFFYLSLVFLIGIFLVLFIPYMRNQKVIIENDVIKITHFGKIDTLSFEENLIGIVEKNEEIVSYRFNKCGKWFQISPSAYSNSSEMENIFKELISKEKVNFSIVSK